MSARSTLLLEHHLKELKLPTFLREYRKLATQCAAEGADHPDYLLRLAELELIDRHQRMVQRRIRAARFPATKSLDTFDFLAIPSLNKPLVMQLARCEYIERRENVIVIGNSGTGKTHVALGLGLAACQRGMSVGFTTAAALVHELMEARDDRRLLNLQRQLARLNLLIIDELGFVPLSTTGAELLFEVFSQRYERGSILVTTNLPFDEWTEVFGSERLTGALLDRLTHHVHILEITARATASRAAAECCRASASVGPAGSRLASCQGRPRPRSRRHPPPNRPGRDRQASPRWYSFTPPQWYVLPPPLTTSSAARTSFAIGNSGTGKTHVALGLGLAVCQRGMSVGFTTAAALVHELMEARDDRRLLNLQRQLARLNLLIIDELGFVPLSTTGAELLFEVFSQRYERGSILVTTNLPFDEWTEVFGSERLTGALLDRLTHHVHILEMNGDSYRLKGSRQSAAALAPASDRPAAD